MRIELWVAMIAASLSTPAAADDSLGKEWLDLWTRCRIAIETVQAPNVVDLDNLGRVRVYVPGLNSEVPGPNSKTITVPIVRGHETIEQKWGTAKGHFIIAEREFAPNDGKVERSCDLKLAFGTAPISPEEERLITGIFIAERKRLLATGKYEIRDPAPIFSTSLGIGPIENNPEGCRVISTLMIDTSRPYHPFFESLNGEQTSACGGPSRLGW